MLEIVGIHQRIAAIYIIDQQTVYYERKLISAVFDWVGKDSFAQLHYKRTSYAYFENSNASSPWSWKMHIIAPIMRTLYANAR